MCCTAPGVQPIPSSPSLFSLQRLTDETVITDPGKMAYQAGNPWLRPKPVGSRRSLRAPQTLLGDNSLSSTVFVTFTLGYKTMPRRRMRTPVEQLLPF